MALASVTAGNTILATDLNQYFNLFTGVLDNTGITLLRNDGNYHVQFVRSTAPAKTWGITSDATNGTLGFDNITANKRVLTFWPSDSVFIGDTPGSDPGANNFWTQGIIRGGAGSANSVELVGGATTVNPIVRAVGTDTNIDLQLTPKGTGSVYINTPSATGLGASGNLTANVKGGASLGPLSLAAVSWMQVRFGGGGSIGYVAIYQ